MRPARPLNEDQEFIGHLQGLGPRIRIRIHGQLSEQRTLRGFSFEVFDPPAKVGSAPLEIIGPLLEIPNALAQIAHCRTPSLRSAGGSTTCLSAVGAYW